MFFAGVDASTKTGAAVVTCKDNKPVLLAKAVLSNKSCSGVARALFIADSLLEMLTQYEIKLVVMEGYSYGSTQRIVDMVEIGTIIRYQLLRAGFVLKLCPPSNLKKFVTGVGNADKKRVILDAHKRWGFDLSDDNECDAACLATMAAAHSGAYIPSKAMLDEAAKLLICK
jgi:crossover junction endodeoxyribonuclease RuvC